MNDWVLILMLLGLSNTLTTAFANPVDETKRAQPALSSLVLNDTIYAQYFHFEWRGYTYRGLIDNAVRLGGDSPLETHTSVSDAIEYLVNGNVRTEPQGVATQPGDGAEGYWANVKITFDWIMEGGSLTYGECVGLLDHFKVLLPATNHPIDAKILIGRNEMVGIQVTKVPYEALQVQAGDLTLDGAIYPSRKIPYLGVRSSINQVKAFVNSQGLDNFVNPPVNEEFPALDCTFALELVKIDTGSPYPEYKYRDLRSLFVELQKHYESEGRFCVTEGELKYPDEEGDDIVVGVILLDEGLELDAVTNDSSSSNQGIENTNDLQR